MKKLMIYAMILLFSSGLSYAQDPGAVDSVIVQVTEVDNSVDSIFVPVMILTDDSVAYYNIPLEFNSSETGITFERIDYSSTLLNWDDPYFDSIEENNFLRNFGFMDIGDEDNPPLHTNGQAVEVLTLVFSVDPGAPDQFVDIVITDDPINGSLLFGLTGGTVQFVPAFKYGWIRFGSPVSVDENGLNIPNQVTLNQNYPNPFNPSTNIDFALPSDQNVRIEVFNILGQQIKLITDNMFNAGFHTVSWDGSNNAGEDVPSGIYFYNMSADGFVQANKMMLLR